VYTLYRINNSQWEKVEDYSSFYPLWTIAEILQEISNDKKHGFLYAVQDSNGITIYA
jgi:restriction endonuclease S subunit